LPQKKQTRHNMKKNTEKTEVHWRKM